MPGAKDVTAGIGKLLAAIFLPLFWLLSPLAAFSVTAHAADAEKILALAGVTPEQLQDLGAGKVVEVKASQEPGVEVNEQNLYLAVIVRLRAPLSTAYDTLKQPRWAGGGVTDALISRIEPGAAFPTVRFDESDPDEITGLLRGEEGANISAEEQKQLEALGLRAPYRRGAIDKFASKFSQILRRRHEDYVDKGVAGIRPYQGDGGPIFPGEHIKTVNEEWNKLLPKIVPGYSNQLALAPKRMGEYFADQGFYVVRKNFDDESVVALVHRFGRMKDGLAVAVHREYYVSKAYIALQAVVLGVPYGNGTLLVLGNDAFTDQVSGFGTSLKHQIGREKLAAKMKEMLVELRSSLE